MARRSEGFNYDTHRPELDFVERKKRQQLRESNVEIRDLEAKLRQAYVNRALAVQIAQKEVTQKREKELREAEHQRAETERMRALEAEMVEEQKARVESLKLLKSLDAQMEEKQKIEQADFKQFLAEKRLIDEVIAKVKEEERNRVAAAMHKKQVEADTIREFVEGRKVWAVKEKEASEEENRQIIKFIEKKDAWRREQEAIAKDRRSLKNESILKLAEDIHQQQRDEEERTRLMHELHEGRLKEVEMAVDQAEIEREVRRKLQLRESNALAIEVRRKQMEQRRVEEEAWKRKMTEEAEREAKLEQMSDQKRRMKRLEFQREAQRNVEERRLQKEAEKRADEQFWRDQKEEQIRREETIEAERCRLLREHATRLIGFMPQGLLKPNDLEMLADDDLSVLYKPSAAVKDPLEEIEQHYEKLNKKKVSSFKK